MNKEQIRTLTNHFCQTFKKFGGKPEDLKGICVVLDRVEDGWELKAVRPPFNRKGHVTVIDVPDDLAILTVDDALIDLAGIISARLANASRAINATKTKSVAERSEIAKKAAAARWGK